MDASIGEAIISFMALQFESYRQEAASGLADAIRPFLRVFSTLYVLAVGYMVLMGKTGERAKSWALSIVLLAVIQTAIFESSGYNDWVVEPLMGSASGLAKFFSGSDGTLFGRLDVVIGGIVASVDRLEPTGSPMTNTMAYIKVGLASLILLLAVTAMYMVFLVQTMLAMFSMYVLLYVGPLFLFFTAFAETRFLATTWLKTFSQYALWQVLLALVMSISLPGVEIAGNSLSSWDVIRDGVFTKQYAFTLLFTCLVIYFLLKTSDLSAALTGGTSMQAGLAGGMLGAGMGAMGSGMNASGAGAMGTMQAGAGNLARMGAYGAGRAAGAGAQGAYRAYSALKGIKY